MSTKRLISFGILVLITGGISKKLMEKKYISIKAR